eukprot:m.606908 g.606908  ORF g.606908 m.606908 type:complete len:787 (-) comp58115_c0_seq4:348-2708(-)
MDAALLLPHDITPHPSAVSDALAANHLASFRSVISASYSNSLFNWNFQASPPQSTPLPGHTHWVTCLAVSRGGTLVASGSNDCTVRLWDLASSTLVHIFKGHDNWVNTVAFSPDGLLVASGSHDGTVRLWNVKTGKSVGKPFEQADNWIYSVAFSPDGTRLISAGSDRTIRVLDLHAAAQLTAQPLAQHTALIRSVAYSPDGTKIAAGDLDGLIRLWDTRTGLQIGDSLTGHTAGIYSVAFSPDGARIVSGGEDNTVRIWDATTGLQIGSPLISHLFNVRSVAFSPDGRWIASASEDKTVRIWNATTGLPLGEPLGHSNQVCAVVFAPAALPPAAPAATADQPTPDTRPSVASTAATSATADIPSADLSPAAAAPDSALAAPPPAVIPLSDLPAAVTEPTEPTDMAEPAAAAAEAEPTEPTEPAEPTECFVVSVQAAEPPTATDTALTQCHPEEFGDSGPVSLVSGSPGLTAHTKLQALLRGASLLLKFLLSSLGRFCPPGPQRRRSAATGPQKPVSSSRRRGPAIFQRADSQAQGVGGDDQDDDEASNQRPFNPWNLADDDERLVMIELVANLLQNIVATILELFFRDEDALYSLAADDKTLTDIREMAQEVAVLMQELPPAMVESSRLHTLLGTVTTVLHELLCFFNDEQERPSVALARASICETISILPTVVMLDPDRPVIVNPDIQQQDAFSFLTADTPENFLQLLLQLIFYPEACRTTRNERGETCLQFATRSDFRHLSRLLAQHEPAEDILPHWQEGESSALRTGEVTPHQLEDDSVVLA